MSMYLYNTAPLPWYPAEWNKSVLPFAVVYRMVGSDAVPTHRMLCCSESPYVTEVDGVQVIAIPPGSNHNFTHFSGNDFWHDIGSNDELANAETFGYLNPSEYEFVWCYISIYDEAGNLVYPGSTPTLIEEEEPEPEPEEFDLQSFKTGLAIYLSIRPCVFPHREPVAFLYNGVRLPDIYTVYTPELQEAYPYALIAYLPASSRDVDRYNLNISDRPFYADSDNTPVRVKPQIDSVFKSYVCRTPDLATWELNNEGTVAVPIGYDNVVWADDGIYFGQIASGPEGGYVFTEEVFMAESEPTPVYE